MFLQDPGGDKRRTKEEKEEEEDDDEDTLDWWSRYYETMKFIDAEAEDKKKVWYIMGWFGMVWYGILYRAWYVVRYHIV